MYENECYEVECVQEKPKFKRIIDSMSENQKIINEWLSIVDVILEQLLHKQLLVKDENKIPEANWIINIIDFKNKEQYDSLENLIRKLVQIKSYFI